MKISHWTKKGLVLAMVAALSFTFTQTTKAEESKSGFSRFMSKVSDSFSTTFLGEGVELAITKLREQRQNYPEILTEDVMNRVENALLQGDKESIKVLLAQLATTFKKPTQASVKSFVAWFEAWEENGGLKVAKMTATKASNLPSIEDYQTKISGGNHFAQVVGLWLYRDGSKYSEATDLEKALKETTDTASVLKSTYAEDFKTAKQKVKDDSKNPFWQCVCGEMEAYGLGTSQSASGAIGYYRKAALQGYNPAIIQFVRCANANSSLKDSVRFEALIWLKKLSLLDNSAAAEMAIGLMYMNGQGVARDHGMALISLEDAAKGGIPQAMYAIGKIYATGGVNVAKDETKSAQWLALAKAKGYDHSIAIPEGTDTTELEKIVTGTPTADDLALAALLFKDIFQE